MVNHFVAKKSEKSYHAIFEGGSVLYGTTCAYFALASIFRDIIFMS